MRKTFAIVLIICFFLLTNTVNSLELIDHSIIYISKSGDENFTKIQEGIDAADSGDIIYVYNGTYFENIVIDKSITLIGENKNNTIIDGRTVGNTIKINADYVTIKNFTIQNSGLIFPLSGINLSSNNNVIENNLINDNYYGITLYFSSENTINKNIIKNDHNCGIYIINSKNNLIIENIIKNHIYNGIGVYYSSNNNIIERNNFINNSFCAVNIRISSNNTINSNNFSNNNICIHIPNNSNIASNNIFLNNKIEIEKEFVLYENVSIIIIIFAVIISLIVVISLIIIRQKRKKSF